jgi:hypothetical protein
MRAEHFRAFPGTRNTRVDGQCTVDFKDDLGTLRTIPAMIMEVKDSSGEGLADAYIQAGLTCRKTVVSDRDTVRQLPESYFSLIILGL